MLWSWWYFFSDFKYLTAIFLFPSITRIYSSVIFISYPLMCFSYSFCWYSQTFFSISMMYKFEPIIYSKYSSSPGWSLFPDFAFICDICSTSPCKIKNLLFDKSIPYYFNLFRIYVCVDYLLFISYLDMPEFNTVRLKVNAPSGTSLTKSFPNTIIFLKETSTAALDALLCFEEWINWFNLFNRIQLALYPKIKSML